MRRRRNSHIKLCIDPSSIGQPDMTFGIITMKRICPNPTSWNDAFTQLMMYSEAHPCMPPSPPKPLILAGWAYSNDVEKRRRWEKTVDWATDNGCAEIVTGIPDKDFYFVSDHL